MATFNGSEIPVERLDSDAWSVRNHLLDVATLKGDDDCPTLRQLADAFGTSVERMRLNVEHGVTRGWIWVNRRGRGRRPTYRVDYSTKKVNDPAPGAVGHQGGIER